MSLRILSIIMFIYHNEPQAGKHKDEKKKIQFICTFILFRVQFKNYNF
jgi:hypothetical protein